MYTSYSYSALCYRLMDCCCYTYYLDKDQAYIQEKNTNEQPFSKSFTITMYCTCRYQAPQLSNFSECNNEKLGGARGQGNHYWPRMGNGLFAGVSLLGVELHEVADEVLGRIRYLIPIRRVKLIVTTHYLVKQLSIIFMVERRVAT